MLTMLEGYFWNCQTSKQNKYTGTHWSSSWGQILLDFLFICENFSYLVISTQQLDYELKISITTVDEGTPSRMEIKSE